ncbi:hypothetical protein ACTXJ5_05780 [Psychrobacter alimentarius]|uniref:hypothetical protein n=1 Tax=Psychrobacter alimentarius TaxID=261164 RepID=UPI003FD0A158
MTRLVEISRQNGKSTLLKRMAAIDPSAKNLTQDIFRGHPKYLKWAVVDTEGRARLFINKPRLTGAYSNIGKDIWFASHLAEKDTAKFRKKYGRGVVVDEGFACEIYTKSEHDCILRREVA